MGVVRIGSDFHIGHRNIHKFRCKANGFPLDFKDETEHREWLFDWINDNVHSRDTLLLPGDIAFNEEAVLAFLKLPGVKTLIGGNHECKHLARHAGGFKAIWGLYKYKGIWLSHAPIHPVELRGKPNFHGHVHQHSLPDTRYENMCVESLVDKFGTPMVEWSDLIEYRKTLVPDFKECEYD